jgi:hypothetical protein
MLSPRPAGLNFTRSKQDDGLLQFVAGIGLVDVSGVLRWSHEMHNFECPTDADYQKFWEKHFDAVFGRVASWNTFSTAAEFLLKGLLLSYEIPIRKPKKVKNYPKSTLAADVQLWAKNYASSQDKKWVPTYGTLSDLLHEPMQQLFAKLDLKNPVDQSQQFIADRDLIFAAYDLLRGSIRNRDAHAYVPNVRNAHQPLREALLLPALNVLTKWMPYERRFLSESYANRKALVAAAGAEALEIGAPYED